MIEFIKESKLLLLKYEPQTGTEWIYQKIKKDDNCRIKRTFTFAKEDLYVGKQYFDDNNAFLGIEDSILFIIAELDGNYYRFKKNVLGLDVNLYIHKDIKFDKRIFIAQKNISVFKIFNKVIKEDIKIGNGVNDIPIDVFIDLIKNFPNRTELQKYVQARVSSTIQDYVDSFIDARNKYENYINRYVKSIKGENLLNTFAKSERMKYETLLNKLIDMLNNEINYTEKQWQYEILQIIQLIYPKYIRVFDEVEIKDVYHNKKRFLDLLLVDSNGNVDIIEIKKPFNQSIVSYSKYRDNHIPLRELSGSIMQIEKYIFYLNKWGRIAEEKLTQKYSEELPNNFKIKITNPSGIIIMGREHNLTSEQLEDFEVIKRKYKNVVDIITYDELIKRLKQIIQKYEKITENVL